MMHIARCDYVRPSLPNSLALPWLPTQSCQNPDRWYRRFTLPRMSNLQSNSQSRTDVACDGGHRSAELLEARPLASRCEQCLWCNKVLVHGARRGSPKRFCCAGHRNAFWSAARRWVMRAMETGLLPAQALKGHQQSVHAFVDAVPWDRNIWR
jgi:hypothetical protein